MAGLENAQSYYILSSNGVLALDLDRGDSSPGTKCIGWQPHFDSPADNRVWQLQQVASESWKVINRKSQTALTLKNGSSDDGTPVTGSPSFASDSQIWHFEATRLSGQVTTYVIRNKASNTVMDLSNSGTSDGTDVIGYRAKGGWNQSWILIPANA